MFKIDLKFVLFLLFALSLFGATQACKSEINSPAKQELREVTDDLGRTIRVPVKLERVISLAPNLTENIFAAGGGDRLIGVTTYCDFPAKAKEIQKVGDTINPNIETIIALKPQIVFVSTASQIEAFTAQMESQNIAVFVTNPKSLDDVLRNLKQFGELFQTTETSDKLIGDLKKRIDETERKVSGKAAKKVFVQISKEPLFTIGGSSFLTDLIKRAGGESVTANVAEAYPKFSKETALALQPEIIILSDSDDNKEPNDVFKDSPAFKNGKVFKINADIISRPTTRLVDALEQIVEKINQ